jgi:hypothetical protein
MKITRTTALLTATALTFGLGACGGDDEGGAAGSPLAEALAADMLDEGEGSPVATEEEANCWANSIVDEIGEDRLEELGMTVENVGDVEDYDFTDDEMSTMVESMFDCIDVKAAFAAEFEEDFGAEGAECVADALDEDLVKEAMLAEQSGAEEPSAEFMQAFLDIAAECDLDLGGS